MSLEDHQRAVFARKRRDIVDAAQRLFAMRGFDRSTMQAVAKEAGVSLATLYKHFGNKEALFGSIVRERSRSFVQDLAGLANPAASLEAGLQRFLLAYARVLADPSTAQLLRLVLTEAQNFPELAETFYQQGKGPLFASLLETLSQHADTLEKRALEPLAVRQLAGMIEASVVWRTLLGAEAPTPEHLEEVATEAVRTWLARYRAS